MCVIAREFGAYLTAIVEYLPGAVGFRARAWRMHGVLSRLGAAPSFSRGTVVASPASISIGDNFGCGTNCVLTADDGGAVKIGNNVALNNNVHVNASFGGTINIGDSVLIGPNVVIRASDHRFASTLVPIREQGHTAGVVTIEDDCWIGANVTVTKGVRIGRGAVVGANSAVVSDVEPFTIVGGVPARRIGTRGTAPVQG